MCEKIVTGFYLDELNIETNLRNITKLKNEVELFDSLYVYLQGACDIFAEALNKEYGYPIYKIGSVHYYCKEIKDGETFYIDIRGITNNKETFKRSLYNPNVNMESETLVQDESFCCEIHDELSKESTLIIEEYRNYYDLNLIVK